MTIYALICADELGIPRRLGFSRLPRRWPRRLIDRCPVWFDRLSQLALAMPCLHPFPILRRDVTIFIVVGVSLPEAGRRFGSLTAPPGKESPRRPSRALPDAGGWVRFGR